MLRSETGGVSYKHNRISGRKISGAQHPINLDDEKEFFCGNSELNKLTYSLPRIYRKIAFNPLQERRFSFAIFSMDKKLSIAVVKEN